jgi:hypothetical protein
MERESSSYVGRNGEKRSVYRFVVGRRNEKRPLGKPKNRCEGTVKMNLEERDWKGLVCFIVAQAGTKRPAVASTIPNLRFS